MPESSTQSRSALHLDPAVPILRVASLEDSIQHYVEVLGFAVSWRAPGVIAAVTRDRCTIFLCEDEQGHVGGWVWVGVDDAERLHTELRSRGAIVRMPPTNFSWAFEMHVEDPDGNVLRFGSDSHTHEPFGEWRDHRRAKYARGDEATDSPGERA